MYYEKETADKPEDVYKRQVLNMHPLICYKLARFVPTVWAELARIATVDHTYYWLPSLSYMEMCIRDSFYCCFY